MAMLLGAVALSAPGKHISNMRVLAAEQATAHAAPMECPLGCTAVDVLAQKKDNFMSMHGDPIFKVNGTVNTHFWITEGSLTNLLTWPAADAAGTWSMAGTTFSKDSGQNQWFDKLMFKFNEIPVLDISTAGGDMTVKLHELEGKLADITSTLQPGVKAESNGISIEVMPIKESETNRKRLEYAFYGKGVKLAVKIGDFYMLIYSHVAAKYAWTSLRKQYTHLNVNFWSDMPQGSAGLFSELAGATKMSSATSALLKRPGLYKERLSKHVAEKKADTQKAAENPQYRCECPPGAAASNTGLQAYTFSHYGRWEKGAINKGDGFTLEGCSAMCDAEDGCVAWNLLVSASTSIAAAVDGMGTPSRCFTYKDGAHGKGVTETIDSRAYVKTGSSADVKAAKHSRRAHRKERK